MGNLNYLFSSYSRTFLVRMCDVRDGILSVAQMQQTHISSTKLCPSNSCAHWSTRSITFYLSPVTGHGNYTHIHVCIRAALLPGPALNSGSFRSLLLPAGFSLTSCFNILPMPIYHLSLVRGFSQMRNQNRKP